MPWRSHPLQQQQQQRRRLHVQADPSTTTSPVEGIVAAEDVAATTEDGAATAEDGAATAEDDAATAEDDAAPETLPIEKLPRQCTGCGALSQLSFPGQPGFYDLNRKAVRKFLGVEVQKPRPIREEEKVAEDAIKRLAQQGVDVEALGLVTPPSENVNCMCFLLNITW